MSGNRIRKTDIITTFISRLPSKRISMYNESQAEETVTRQAQEQVS